MNNKIIKNKNSLNKPTKEQIKKVIEESGYLLEQKICPIIERSGFFTIPNYQYQDQDTGKLKEIDVYALNSYSLYKNEFRDRFEINILIECKNNSTPVIFFTHLSHLKGKFGFIVLNGYPDGIYDEEKKTFAYIKEYFNFKKFYHNYKIKWYASQFCQMKRKKGSHKKKIEWIASHERLYESTENLVKATYYCSSEHKNRIILNEDTKDLVNLLIVYPVLLFAGKIYECRVDDKKYRLYEKNHLTLYKTTVHRNERRTCHIDVIKEDYLQRFLDIIEEENKKIVKQLRIERKLLKANVQRNFEEQKNK